MRRYSNGFPETDWHCIAEVLVDERFRQCRKRRGHGPDGAFCLMHAKALKKGRPVRVPEEVQS